MPPGIPDYPRRSAVLLQAAERFEVSLDNAGRREGATRDLLVAAERDSFADVHLGFEADRDPASHPPVSDGLSAVLFDLQSANVLVAAGLSGEKPRDQSGRALFKQAQQEIATTRQEILAPAVIPTGFAAQLELQSATLDSAVTQFRNYSDLLLGEIVGEAEKTVTTATTELKKLDPSELVKALGQIGEAVPIVVKAGQMVRQGLEKLKRSIEALMEIFGKGTLKKAREKIEQLLKEAGVSSRALLQFLLGTESVKERIGAILATATLSISKVDTASNSLPALARNFNRDNQLLRALLRAIQLAGLLLALLQFAAPWLAPTLAIAYVSVIGAALLIGRQYTGVSRALSSTDGLEQVAERIP